MSKRAQYRGGHDAVDIQPWRLDANGVATADESVVTVKKGDLTPEDVPDHFIDGLLEQAANWVEFKRPAPAEPESAASDTKE